MVNFFLYLAGMFLIAASKIGQLVSCLFYSSCGEQIWKPQRQILSVVTPELLLVHSWDPTVQVRDEKVDIYLLIIVHQRQIIVQSEKIFSAKKEPSFFLMSV